MLVPKHRQINRTEEGIETDLSTNGNLVYDLKCHVKYIRNWLNCGKSISNKMEYRTASIKNEAGPAGMAQCDWSGGPAIAS